VFLSWGSPEKSEGKLIQAESMEQQAVKATLPSECDNDTCTFKAKKASENPHSNGYALVVRP
jgi:hypothetical protein